MWVVDIKLKPISGRLKRSWLCRAKPTVVVVVEARVSLSPLSASPRSLLVAFLQRARMPTLKNILELSGQ
jgi:hypothetical protein